MSSTYRKWLSVAFPEIFKAVATFAGMLGAQSMIGRESVRDEECSRPPYHHPYLPTIETRTFWRRLGMSQNDSSFSHKFISPNLFIVTVPSGLHFWQHCYYDDSRRKAGERVHFLWNNSRQ